MSAAVPLERKHIPPLPAYILPLRGLQLLLGIILLGLSAYGISVYSTPGLGLTIFTSLVTLIATIYAVLTDRKFGNFFNYWAIIALDLFLVIFWLISFAKDAAEANGFRWLTGFGFVWVGPTRTWRNTLIVDSVFGAFQFILFILTLGTMMYYVMKHRDAGGHCVPYTGQPDVELGQQQHIDQSKQAAQYNRQPPVPPVASNRN